MNPSHRKLLHALAVASLAVLGWDAFQPRPDFPASIPKEAPASATHPPLEAVSTNRLQFTHLTADRFLMPGQQLTVRGSVQGLTQTNPATLSLEGPDGSIASVELQDPGTHETRFTLQHPTPAIAPGSFSWKLRLNPAEDPLLLGVDVGDPIRPRVLLLQDHPDVEGSRLQRWLTETGSPITTRTRVSTERHRISSSSNTAIQLEQLTAPALASFDVVVAHASALDRLSPEEHQSLELAIRTEGVGLLILLPQESSDDPGTNGPPPSTTPSGDDAPRHSTPDAVAGRSPLVSPWIRRLNPSSSASVTRRETRIHLSNGIRLESPVSVPASELVVPPVGQALAQDPQGRPIVATGSLGRGRWACSLVLDSWRWRQHGREGDYAHFWSTLLSAVARPVTASTGAWSVEDASLPLFVDQPVTLVWSGNPDAPLPAAEVRAHNAPGEPSIALSLNRHPSESSQGQAVFWPVHPGWHTLRTLPTGPTLDFHVQPSHALPGVQARKQRDAAQRTRGDSTPPPPVTTSPKPASWSRPLIRLTGFLGFVFSVACLWPQRGPLPSRRVG